MIGARTSILIFSSVSLFPQKHNSIGNFLSRRASKDCPLQFWIWHYRQWGICPAHLCSFSRRHTHLYNLEFERRHSQFRAEHYHHHDWCSNLNTDHFFCRLQTHWGVPVQCHQWCWHGIPLHWTQSQWWLTRGEKEADEVGLDYWNAPKQKICDCIYRQTFANRAKAGQSQGILTVREGSVQLPSLVLISFFPFYKTNYLNMGVNHTEPSPSVRIPQLSVQL